METPVSVVVNTYNRAPSLRRTLRAFSQLDYPNFEVVVVDGPSTDETSSVLGEFQGRIKLGKCHHRNLSESRNIGISLAAGEIIAFIDDDAYPDPGWLDRLVESYDSSDVAGAGGPVWDRTGAALQAKYSIANRFGRARISNDVSPEPYLTAPHSREIPYLIGTNASFLRARLVDIGGFDEFFEYFLDETDVCCRLIDQGLRIRLLDDGFVYHKFAPSDIRGGNGAIRSRYNVLRSTCYFALKHGLPFGSFAQVCEELSAALADHRRDYRSNVDRRLLTEADAQQFEADIPVAFDDAFHAFVAGEPKHRDSADFAAPPAFLPFATTRRREARLHVCFFSQEWPPTQLNGIARVIHALATGMADIGHVVHVLTRGDGSDQVDLEDGIWVHRVAVTSHCVPRDLPAPQRIWDYSASLCEELLRIDSRRRVDIVQIPNWDSEGISVILNGGFKTVLGLYTPLRTVREVDPVFAAPSEELDQLVALEEICYGKADGLLACGPSIVSEIEERYQISLPPQRMGIVPHGLPDAAAGLSTVPSTPSGLEVLFVGRLEARKGIDTFLESIPSVADEFREARFVIVGKDDLPGPGGTPYRKAFESSTIAKQLGDRVKFAGIIGDDALARHYAECDVFVAPSRFESFELIVLEAMMFGKPVVGCRAGGIPEIIEEEGNGYLVPAGDSKALASAIATLLRSPQLRERFGRRSREIFIERHSQLTMTVQVNRYYDLLLGRQTADAEPPQWREELKVGEMSDNKGLREVAGSQLTQGYLSTVVHHEGVTSRLIDSLVCPTCRSSLHLIPITVTEDARTQVR